MQLSFLVSAYVVRGCNGFDDLIVTLGPDSGRTRDVQVTTLTHLMLAYLS